MEMTGPNRIVEDVFAVMECIQAALRDWQPGNHHQIRQQARRLWVIEDDLYRMGYDEATVCEIFRKAYRSVFEPVEHDVMVSSPLELEYDV